MKFDTIGKMVSEDYMGYKSRGNWRIPEKGFIIYKFLNGLHKCVGFMSCKEWARKDIEQYIIDFVEEYYAD